MIDSVLIANRGEIAMRIIRTCQRLGIRTVGVYSDADAQAPHVAEADQAYRLGPGPASESYLNQAAVLAAAGAAGAAAIHPGYGFLAENAEFAQACLDAGFVWIGPPPAAMRAVGDKARARALAAQHGVPLLDGYHGQDQSAAALRHEADRIGYPVLIKASAGGGGRGMRVVESADAFVDALEAARREAVASFGDDRVLLERYVRHPRHIEVQIFGDRYGHLVHLGERECSIQRRHQKLIEESPSPALDQALRTRMCDVALRLARASGYTSAGTVEFLLDEHGEFAFLEVNARLQVEHPVTEAITGLDLVELQLRVAAGEPLPITQTDVQLQGHAIEARVIAEDPLAGFRPSSGLIERFEQPAFVRFDTWVQTGQAAYVSPYYDSLLGKIIAHAADRPAAVKLLANALQEVWIEGVAHNVDLLLATIEHPAFVAGGLHTGFLEAHDIIASLSQVPAPVMAAVSALDFLGYPTGEADPWRTLTGWRVGRVDQPTTWTRGGRVQRATVSADIAGDGVLVDVDGFQVHARALGCVGPRCRVSLDGRAATVRSHGLARVVEWDARSYRMQRWRPSSIEEIASQPGAGGAEGRLTAPMPGRVVKIAAAVGQAVSLNQPLIVIEAMKMEHVVEASRGGVVAELCVAVGDQVASGAQLLVLGSTDAPTDLRPTLE